jgi:hypothetical protein
MDSGQEGLPYSVNMNINNFRILYEGYQELETTSVFLPKKEPKWLAAFSNLLKMDLSGEEKKLGSTITLSFLIPFFHIPITLPLTTITGLKMPLLETAL